MRPAFLAVALSPLALAACAPAQQADPGRADAVAAPMRPISPATEADDPALASAVAAFLGADAAATRTVTRIVGRGEQRLALVYLVGMNWCGSGGCNLLILRPGAAGWETVGNIARVRPPVRMLATSSRGLPDIGVTVSGGGGPPAYEARMAFDGSTYPRFPSDQPLIGADGWVVIAEADLPPPVD